MSNNQQLVQLLKKVLSSEQKQYTIKGRDIDFEEMLSDAGLMPAIAKRADQLSMLCLGYGIGVQFAEKERSLLGSTVQFDDATPLPLRLLFLYDVVTDLGKGAEPGAKIQLDELLYD